MLVNKITASVLTNNTNSNNCTGKNHFLKPLEADTFVKFTGADRSTQKTKSRNADTQRISRLIAELREDPDHPERRNLSDKQLLHALAMLDFLTGLKNKRSLYIDLKKDIKTARDQGKSISMAMFDMDNFKSVNDLLGHDDVGDEFLRVIGEEIGKVSGQNDCKAYRYGGEEFIITMPGKNLETAVNIAEEVRKNINQNPVLQGYYDSYIAKAQEKMGKLQAIQKPFGEFKKYLAEHEIRQKDLMDYQGEEHNDSLIVEFLAEKAAKSMSEVYEKFLKLLEHALSATSSKAEKQYLRSKIDSLQNGGKFSDIYNETLKNYLNTRLNKEFEISQIINWINHAQKLVDGKPQGFTITAGVKELKDLDPCTKDPLRCFIDQTDQVLIKGKNEGRGRVYAF